MTDRILYQ